MATPACPANVRETQIAFGFQPQVDLPTINADPELWSLTKTNPALSTVELSTEDNSDDIGKGDEFPTEVFPTSSSTGVAVEKYLSSEFAAWLFLFSLGNGTKAAAGTGGFLYEALVSDPAVACINVPAFTWAERVRPEPESVVDQALIGMCVNNWTITLESGPGRNNCRVSTNFLGIGKVAVPSGVTIPPITAEHMLNASGATVLTINGIDYLLGTGAGSFISAEIGYNNNIRTDSGYFPGSGLQNGFAIRGRMEYNKREFTLNFVARARKGSPELTNLLNMAEGNAEIKIEGGQIDVATKHGVDLKFNRTQMSAVTNGDADGIITVNCSARILKPTTATPMVQFRATTTKDAIFGL